jgi:hypothetical protein
MLDEEKASRGSWLRTFGSSAQQGMLHSLLTNVLWYALLTPSQVSKFIELVGHDFCEYF